MRAAGAAAVFREAEAGCTGWCVPFTLKCYKDPAQAGSQQGVYDATARQLAAIASGSGSGGGGGNGLSAPHGCLAGLV